MITTNVHPDFVPLIIFLYKEIGYEVHRIEKWLNKTEWRITFRKIHPSQIHDK